ncbi:Ribonuclease H-like domain [Pseudocohnilembus persalinus]|uniref:Ribonuclease H-like domain n=1 Tax=Pseudocohnilembus persalinus TaxID=266149 RepID=A0A0V0QX63_PSEPJ|nr:Ribonuclease H-like domain [Pseudocohnilembus persalinus]|eukprot:KRX06839.1 Ribonuclease H-like domain [Pseudocohnilembus persalinus]
MDNANLIQNQSLENNQKQQIQMNFETLTIEDEQDQDILIKNSNQQSVNNFQDQQLLQQNKLERKYSFIKEIQQLEELSQLLQKQTIFSFDIHNHSYRSFLGFSCFMEISTINQDFVIDVLALRENINSILGPIFENQQFFKSFQDFEEPVQQEIQGLIEVLNCRNDKNQQQQLANNLEKIVYQNKRKQQLKEAYDKQYNKKEISALDLIKFPELFEENQENIPQNLEQIFAIANKNRKKNKNKKKNNKNKCIESPASQIQSPIQFQYYDQQQQQQNWNNQYKDHNGSSQKKNKHQSKIDTQEILKDIGWIQI